MGKLTFRLSTDQKKVDSVSVADEELELETKKDEVAVQLSELAKFVAGHPDIKDVRKVCTPNFTLNRKS